LAWDSGTVRQWDNRSPKDELRKGNTEKRKRTLSIESEKSPESEKINKGLPRYPRYHRSRKIALLRKTLHLSADRFGASIGYVGGYIFYIESGEYSASDEFCEKVAVIFRVKKEWLLNDEIPVEPIIYEASGAARLTPGDRLREVFENSGLTQREFCKRVGGSTSMLVPLMDGRRQITVRYAEKIELAFGVGVDWLLYGREECKDYPCGDEMIAFLKSNPKSRKIVWKMMQESRK